jgi:hypothetical protein
MCGLTVTELMAAKRGVSPAEIGYFRLRAPVKPLSLQTMKRSQREPIIRTGAGIAEGLRLSGES